MTGPRKRYWLQMAFEVPAPTLTIAVERVLRLFRRRVRDNLRGNTLYQGAYRGTWVTMTTLQRPPSDRVNLVGAAKKHRTLRKRRKKGTSHAAR